MARWPPPDMALPTLPLLRRLATVRAAFKKNGGWRSVAWPLVMLLFGGLVTTLATTAVSRRLDSEAHAEFDRFVERLATETQRRMNQPIFGLKGARAMFDATPHVGAAQFRDFVASHDLPRDYPGTRGFGYIEHVRRADLPGYEAAARAEGVPDFAVRSSGDRGDLFVIRYIEPLAPNGIARGLDLNDDEARRSALELAIMSGEPTLTPMIRLVQDDQKRPAFLVFLPVYAGGGPLDIEEDRWVAQRGVLYAPIIAEEILRGVGDVVDGRLDFEVFDGPATSLERLVFDLDGHLATRAGPVDAPNADRRLEALRVMAIGGRSFTLRASTTPAFDAGFDRSLTSAIAWAGAALTVLGAFVVWLLVAGRARVARRVQDLTADLSLLARVAKQTSNAVIVTDAARRVKWVNEGFQRVTGYTAAEVVGRSPGQLLQSEHTDPATIAAMRRELDAGRGFRGELCNRAKDGRDYWLAVEIEPLFASDGTLSGFMAIESDITQAKAAVEALRRERERLANVLDGTNAGTGEWNVRTGELRMNARWAQMLGYAEGGIGATLQDWWGLCHPDDVASARLALQRHVAGELPYFEHEMRMRHRAGRWLWIQARGRVSAYGADGQPEWLSGTLIDVTDRRRAANLWQARAELSGDWFWQTDTQHRFIDLAANEAMRSGLGALPVVGLRRDEIRWLSPPEGGWAAFHAALDHHAVFKGVCYLAAPDGAPTRHVEIDGRPRFDDDGRFLGYEGVGRDVTERRQVTENLRGSLALIDALFEGIPVPVVMKDAQYRYVRMNKAYSDLFGLRAADVLGKSARDLIDAAAADRHDAEDQALLDTPGTRTYELQQHLNGGRSVDALVSKSTLLDADGRVLGLVGTMVDITELKAAQRALAEAKDAAEAASRAKSAFLATMSHEIRTPMNGVLGMAELLAHSRLDEEQAQTVRTVRESATALLRLIDDILDFSKIEAGRLELEHEPVALTELAEGVCEALEPVAADKRVALHLFIAPATPERILADDVRLRQLLNNLVGNAIKFSAGQPARDGRVQVRLAPEGGGLRIDVLDNGIGIDATTVDRLFTPFTQAEVSTTRRFGGTGLGLAICRRLVELMQGHIDVTSQPGEGSTFSIWLPLQLAPDQPAPARAELAGLDCILIAAADADLPVADLGVWLEHAGARVQRVDALAAALQCAPGLRGPAVLIQADLPDRRAELPEVAGLDLRHLLVGRGRRGPARAVASNAVALDLARRAPFLRAVAMLAGRASPESLPMRMPDPLSDARVAPLSVAQAFERGQLILVAEDDSTNRAVILRQLALLGLAAEVAQDGAQALQMWRSGRHVLLLSDLHMPEMDGYALAEAIRSEEAARGIARMPILALTANAMKGEATRARAAGMDDYLTKPVPVRLLQAALNQWLPAPRGAAGGTAPVALDAAAVDLAVLHGLVGDDAHTVQEILVEFLASAREQAGALRQAYLAGDRRHAGAIAHKLKSAARSVGAMALGDLCAGMEQQRLVADPGAMGDDLIHFDRTFSAVVGQIEAQLGVVAP